MCVFIISPVPITEPLTSELIDTPVFYNLAPRPIKYRVSVPIPTLNNEDNVIKVMEEWPYLFEVTHLLDHTEKLMGFPVQTKLLNQIEEKGKTITEFLVSKGITGVTTKSLKLLRGLMEYLGEEPKLLLINNEVSTQHKCPHLFLFTRWGK